MRPHTAWVSVRPWGDIRGMGNRLRHAYDRISLDVIWNAVSYDLPGLATDARRALAHLRGSSQSGDPSRQARSLRILIL